MELQIPVGDVEPLFGLKDRLKPAQRAAFAAALEGRATLGLADCFRLLHQLAAEAGEETFALSARPVVKGAAAFVLGRAAGAATLGEALRRLAEGYNILHGGAYNRVDRRAGRLTFAIHDDAFPYTRPRDDYIHFSLECALLFVHATLSELAHADLSAKVRRVATRRPHAQGAGASALAFWRAPVNYAAPAYVLAYDAALEDAPVQGMSAGLAPDLAVHQRILSLIEAAEREGEAARTVRAAVHEALAAGAADLPAVAERLGLSVATVRRRLAEEDTSFRDIHRGWMNAYARARVREAPDLASVAEELGFSDPRAFTRAFKTWNGVTPSDFRRQGYEALVKAGR